MPTHQPNVSYWGIADSQCGMAAFKSIDPYATRRSNNSPGIISIRTAWKIGTSLIPLGEALNG